jgi:tRNA/rRNA methyltransferase
MPITVPADRPQPQPTLEGTDLAVAEIVRAAYEKGIETALALGPAPGLAREQVMEALGYCAERQCDAAGARCRACKLWTEEAGIETLDEYCRLFPEIAFGESPLRVTGGGSAGSAAAPEPAPATLDELAKTWPGEEFWFLARRTLRRLRHKEGQARKLAGATLPHSSPVFVLVEPQIAENVGMVARAMANFALDELRLVKPRDGWQKAKARAAASGAYVIVEEAGVHASTREAIADLHWVAATTARPRQLAKPVLTPREAAAEMQRRIAAGERVGVLFGAERTGLSTDDIADADAIVMARVNPTFASLNLAQAVLLVAYEWLETSGGGTIGRHTSFEGVEATGLSSRSPPASKAEMMALFEHLEADLERSGHFKPPEKRPIMVRNLRTMLERMAPSEQEVRTLRGIVAALTRGPHRGRDEP